MPRRMAALVAALLMVMALSAGTSTAHVDTAAGSGANNAGGLFKYEGLVLKMHQDFRVSAQSRAEGRPAEARCVRGMAAEMFRCRNIDMLSYVSHADMGTTFVNDIWGWTDPQTQRDYALVGASEGTVFVDISDATRPDVLGILPTATTAGGDFWRDIKVFRDHAFVVSENTNHGIQVFDLTQLRGWDGTYTTYRETARYTDHGSSHNINVNEDTGFLYSVGAGQDIRGCNAGLHMVDINDPANPSFAGCFGDHGYIHDTQCVVYDGPDGRYHGREICFNSNATSSGPAGVHRVSIVDVTDKDDVVSLAREPYGDFGYSHQGWLTPNKRFFLHGDELDEQRRGIPTTTRVWDMKDLTSPRLIQEFSPGTTSIDHNVYTEDRYAYASNYTSGLRMLDTTMLGRRGGLREVGYFDLYPENDNATFEGGTWSNYGHFAQPGVIAVSSIDRGMFVLSPRIGRGSL